MHGGRHYPKGLVKTAVAGLHPYDTDAWVPGFTG